MREAGGEIVVLTTLDQEDKANAFARGLLNHRLAACVTRLPAGVSMYRWKSPDITVESEYILLIKTHRDKLADLESYFSSEHPYEVPEFIVLSAEAVSTGYSEWMREEMKIGS
jgi:periplasmic divalent cation tolerance protein